MRTDEAESIRLAIELLHELPRDHALESAEVRALARGNSFVFGLADGTYLSAGLTWGKTAAPPICAIAASLEHLTGSAGLPRFGMTPAEVRAVMTEEEVYEQWMGGNLNDSILYRGLIVRFDRCNGSGPLPDSKVTEIFTNGGGNMLFAARYLDQWTLATLTAFLTSAGIPFTERKASVVEVETRGWDFRFASGGRLEEASTWQVR